VKFRLRPRARRANIQRTSRWITQRRGEIDPQPPTGTDGAPLEHRSRSTVALLHAQPARGWTVDSLAREAAASRSQLAERFSRMLGCPPMEYLTRWRMQLSARRMLEGSEPLKDIAIAVGYESDSGFNRTFRRYFGEPPAHWRRRHREQAGTAEPSAPA
jgi:AraC-like DNA-binding protein